MPLPPTPAASPLMGDSCPPPCSAFYVHRRDRGHWDISVPDGVGRVFAIRGAPGSFSVTDYRKAPATQSIGFRTLDVVMAYCAAELMYEPNACRLASADENLTNQKETP